MPARVRILQRIVAGVAVPVQALRVARACPERSEGAGHDGVGLDEAGGGRVGVWVYRRAGFGRFEVGKVQGD